MNTQKHLIKVMAWALLGGALFSGATLAAKSVSMSDEAILERIKPVGQVNVGGAAATAAADGSAAPAAARSGAEVVAASCATCHNPPGIPGAPKIGNSQEWGPRAEKGIEGMLEIAKSGLNAMPPRGLCADCSDDELKAAIEHMLSESGL